MKIQYYTFLFALLWLSNPVFSDEDNTNICDLPGFEIADICQADSPPINDEYQQGFKEGMRYCRRHPQECQVEQTEHAQFSPEGILYVPYVDVPGPFGDVNVYSVEMQLIPFLENFQFEIINVNLLNVIDPENPPCDTPNGNCPPPPCENDDEGCHVPPPCNNSAGNCPPPIEECKENGNCPPPIEECKENGNCPPPPCENDDEGCNVPFEDECDDEEEENCNIMQPST